MPCHPMLCRHAVSCLPPDAMLCRAISQVAQQHKERQAKIEDLEQKVEQVCLPLPACSHCLSTITVTVTVIKPPPPHTTPPPTHLQVAHQRDENQAEVDRLQLIAEQACTSRPTAPPPPPSTRSPPPFSVPLPLSS